MKQHTKDYKETAVKYYLENNESNQKDKQISL